MRESKEGWRGCSTVGIGALSGTGPCAGGATAPPGPGAGALVGRIFAAKDESLRRACSSRSCFSLASTLSTSLFSSSINGSTCIACVRHRAGSCVGVMCNRSGVGRGRVWGGGRPAHLIVFRLGEDGAELALVAFLHHQLRALAPQVVDHRPEYFRCGTTECQAHATNAGIDKAGDPLQLAGSATKWRDLRVAHAKMRTN